MTGGLTLVILAAGMGSRYGGLKQLEPVGPGGELLIEYSVYDALRSGFEKIVFVIRREMQQEFEAVVSGRLPESIPVTFAFQSLDDLPDPYKPPVQRKKQWGTAHAVYACRQTVTAPFATINADDFYGLRSFQLLSQHLRDCSSDSSTFCSVPFLLRNTLSEHGGVSRGLCRIDQQNFLQSVDELHNLERSGSGVRYRAADGVEKQLSGDELVSMNIWGMTPLIFKYLASQFTSFIESLEPQVQPDGRRVPSGVQVEKAEFYLPVAIDELIKRGLASVRCLPSDEEWFGVTHPLDKASVSQRIRRLVDNGKYPSKLWSRPTQY